MQEPAPRPELHLGTLIDQVLSAFLRAPGAFVAAGLLSLLALSLSFAPFLAINELDARGLDPAASVALEMVAGVGAVLVIELVWLGLLRMSLAALRGRPVRVRELASVTPLVMPGTVASFLAQALTLAGLALCILPGLVFMVVTPLAQPFLLDKGLGPVSAIQASVAATRGVRLQLSLGLALPVVAGCALVYGAVYGYMTGRTSWLALGLLLPAAASLHALTIAAAYEQLWWTARPAA